MPANLPPQYIKARTRYELAKTNEEKVEILKEMLALIPKHKGTDKLRASLRSNLSKLKKEEQKSRKKGKRVDEHQIRKEGAAQVVMIGAPNVGKSKILDAMTNATPEVASYPFTTQKPIVGMMPFENIYIQLVDTPPVMGDSIQAYILDIVRNTDFVLIVVSLDDDDALEQIETIRSNLENAHITLVRQEPEVYEDEEEFIRIFKKTMILCNKNDVEDASQRLEVLQELYAEAFSVMSISAEMGNGLDVLKKKIYQSLDIIRVYTKAPFKPPDKSEPIILSKLGTLLEAAENIHKDFAGQLKFARIWGKGRYDGQPIGRDEPLQDEDIVEFHI